MSLWKADQFRQNNDEKSQEAQAITEITALEHIKRIETRQSHIEQAIQVNREFLRNAIVLTFFIMLVLFRFPEIVIQGGRLWAEEGVIYLKNALTEPWYNAWFALIPQEHAAYINLSAGLATWIAFKLGGLLYAPAITVTIALFIQCLPPFIIITHKFPWKNSLAVSIAAVSICALVPVSGEVWLNTIESQMHLALAAALILAAPIADGWLLNLDLLILILAVFSGPGTSILLPLYIVRTYFERRRGRIIQLSVIFIGFAVQISMYLTHLYAARGFSLTPIDIISISSLHTIVLPFGGLGLARYMSVTIAAINSQNTGLIIVVSLFIMFYLIAALLAMKWRDISLGFLVAASAVCGTVFFAGALTDSYSNMLHLSYDGRYAFVPEVLNCLIIAYIASRGKFFAIKMLSTLLLSWIIVIGISDYRSDNIMFARGPSWDKQIGIWYKNNDYALKIWPYGWKLKIPKNVNLPRRDISAG